MIATAAVSRYSGRTTIRTTPDTVFVRMCAKHPTRKASKTLVRKADPKAKGTNTPLVKHAVAYVPACDECAGNETGVRMKRTKIA